VAKTKQIESLPHNGQVHEPPEKLSPVVFILVHHYGGNNRTLYRHIKLVNSLGFTAVSFELGGAHNQELFLPPISKRKQWGMRHIWADKIEDILKLVSGKKVIFTLSNPSFSVLEAVYRIKGKDIKAIVCDGGPFFDIYKCYWNLFTHAFKYNIVMRSLQLVLGAIYWNPLGYKAHAKKYINSFDQKIPLLSIRAENDILVPVESIDKCLATYNPDMITRVLVKDTGHLMGIKNEKELYLESVVSFLHKSLLLK